MHIDIGRNDYCPCKSGKKFKKCCIDNPMNLFPHHTPPRRHKWTGEEIAEIPVDKIFEKLKLCGIEISNDQFLKDVHESYAIEEIYAKWKIRYTIQTVGADEDFPWLAAGVLWNILAPSKFSTEQLDDMILTGYELSGHDSGGDKDLIGGCNLWLMVWDELKKRFTNEMRKVEDAEKVFNGSESLFNWCQEVEMELGNAAITDPAFYDRRINYCREFISFFPESHSVLRGMRRGIAEALYMSGRIKEAEQEFQTIVSAYPNDPWAYAAWGDMYADVDGGTFNTEKAEELYRKGLGLEPSEDEHLHERIRDLKDLNVVEVLKQAKG